MTTPEPSYDDWYEVAVPYFEAKGYVFTDVQRYEPTIIQGTTPNGVPFTFEVRDGTWTVTYRNRVRSGTIAGAQAYLSAKVQQALDDAVTASGG